MKQVMLGLMCLISTSSIAQQYCLTSGVETTPAADFVDISEGEVLHSATNLIWKRCAEGQTWNGSGCSGEAQKYTWQQALQLALEANDIAQEGWRLPNIKELAAITERLCVRPAINNDVFPATPPDDFWTSTPSLTDTSRAWVVAFFNSSHSIKQKDRFVYVRLVRTNGS
nr:DUF1566 domain-containing protein [Salinimonas lutimaris]